MDEKEFDFGHLTKEQALYLHRKLWNTLADKILEWKRPVEKWEIFVLYDWPQADADCWCCEYSKSCHRCPIEWTNTGWTCGTVYSPYKKWKILTDKYIANAMDKYCLDGTVYKFKDEELKELYDLARKIANLPERKRYFMIDEYDALIRRKFLEMHRKMWNWIADESERRKRCIDKLDAFAHFHLADHGCHWCMACIYGKWKAKYKDLNKYKCREFCMLDWGKDEETGEKLGCINPDHPYQFSLYEQWLLYVDEYDWVHAAQIAREIANLPERKE